MLTGKLFFWDQGLDSSANESWGGNIFLPNTMPPRLYDYGYHIGDGVGATGSIASLAISYELKQNLFIDLAAFFRKYDVPAMPALTKNTTVISIGVRLNAVKREFEF
jgi:hypothetical protein